MRRDKTTPLSTGLLRCSIELCDAKDDAALQIKASYLDAPVNPDEAILESSLDMFAAAPWSHDALTAVPAFGPNPGALRMLVYHPKRLQKQPALVVVLHGCLQTAEGYNTGSGWSKLAERGGFVLLYAEQQKSNNARNCFNWYNPADVLRDSGEVCSIRQMIAKAVADYDINPKRIFICGLSAGGAMTGAMLATYPEVFKAGAILAGLPFGGAGNVSEALESMFTGRLHAARSWGDLVRNAAPRPRRWPSVAVWHGTADNTVKPINAGEIIKQWTDVHGLGGMTPEAEQLGDVARRSWRDADGTVRVIDYSVPGMGHGAPLGGRIGDLEDGLLGPFFLSAGLWSSLRIAQDWGLFDAEGKPGKTKRFAFLGFEF